MCPPNHYAFIENRTCDTECPENYFKELTLRLCLNPCLEGQISDPASL